MHYLICLLMLSLPYVAAAQQPTSVDTIATRLQLPRADCALFPAALPLTRSFTENLSNTKRFTPTQQQVTIAEETLRTIRSLATYSDSSIDIEESQSATIIKKKLAQYRRQYYGFYNAQHEPCLYINFFNRVLSNDKFWLRHQVHVIDAGISVWSIYYNVTENRFYGFRHDSSTRF